MGGLRAYLAIMLVTVVVYTIVVGSNHGWNLLPIFFGDIAAMTWPGQFNLDFACFLCLAGTWLAWRHHFSLAGIALGFVVLIGGMVALSSYLLVASTKASGDMKVLLLGPRRARS